MRPLTVVVDLSVILHQIYEAMGSSGIAPEHHQSVAQAQMAWLMSGQWLGSLKPANPDDLQILLALDQKDSKLKYWRHYHLARPEVVAQIPRKKKADERARLRLLDLLSAKEQRPLTAIEDEEVSTLAERLTVYYKAGRKFPDSGFTKLKKDIYQLAADRSWRCLRVSGFEADDIAAAIVRQNSLREPGEQHDILLLTVDNDWLGMVSDRVKWLESASRYPRLRGDIRSVSWWCQKRQGYPVDSADQIWIMKTIKGDASDALPPGSPIEVIDLFQAPEGCRAWEFPGVAETIERWLDLPLGTQVDPETAQRASDYLHSVGVPKAVKPYDPSQDLPAADLLTA